MTRSFLVLLVLATALGCSRSNEESAQTTPDGTSTASRTSGGEASRSTGLDDSQRECQLQPVYFSYDSSDLDTRTRDALDANARCLRAKPSLAITVVGMTDPRGTEEYNLALGERRAAAAKSYLEALGIESPRIAVHSMGEEHASGEDEASWSRDRRAEPRVR
ncbi:MAG: OmpA family protein [Sandaracinus sp.]|nr:OmpA family protein [Myxococcales bacterium]MCB9601745.1 OmpA family protein [Sandaracinus sp.]MCB9614232.1 OmpA family protein [Sandaracinus sp.]MCB9634366.1 OmpA family protein [Sandaracinus sp.]